MLESPKGFRDSLDPTQFVGAISPNKSPFEHFFVSVTKLINHQIEKLLESQGLLDGKKVTHCHDAAIPGLTFIANFADPTACSKPTGMAVIDSKVIYAYGEYIQ